MVKNFEQAKIDPASVYKRPFDILQDTSLTREEKIEILQRWAYDEREMAVAEEENMQRSNTKQVVHLDEILEALLKLGVTKDQKPAPPTKHG